MIVLDAGVLIALHDVGDVHHDEVVRFLRADVDRSLAASGVTLAESLVHAVREGAAEELLEDFEILGISALDIPGAAAGTIARVRAETRLKLPDALVVYVCERERAELATTDRLVATRAAERGIRVHDLGSSA